MMQKIKCAVGLSALLLSGVAYASQCLYPGFSASYTLYGKGGSKAIGSVERVLLLKSNHQFQFNSQLQAKVFVFKENIKSVTEGRYGSSGFSPNLVHVSESRNNINKTIKFAPKTFGAANYILQLRHDLLSKKKELRYAVVLDGVKENFVFKKIKTSKIQLPMGVVSTVFLEGKLKDGSTNRLWFAKKDGYLLVKTEKIKDGAVIAATVLNGYRKKPSNFCAY